MKTRPISIEPGSGTKFAGKRVVLREYVDDKSSVWEIIYVGASSFMAKNTMFQNEDICKIYPQNDWLEVLPDDLPQDSPKEPPAHEEFFNEWGYFATCFKDEDGLTPTFNQVYQAFESRMLAKLKSDNLI